VYVDYIVVFYTPVVSVCCTLQLLKSLKLRDVGSMRLLIASLLCFLSCR
jgi:hypothetical protein